MTTFISKPTDKITFTISTIQGYFHENEEFINLQEFLKIVKKSSMEAEKIYGIYISLNVIPTITLYKEELGYPAEGEKTYTLTAIRNPLFCNDTTQWKKLVYVSLINSRKSCINQR